MFLFFHELIHLLTGLGIGLFFSQKLKNIKLLLVAFIASTFIDLDHILDLLLYLFYAHQPFNPLAILSVNYFKLSGKIFVLLHSYELVLILIVLGLYLVKWRYHLWVIAVSFLFHILIDQFTYSPKFQEYFLIYRFINSFSIEAFK